MRLKNYLTAFSVFALAGASVASAADGLFVTGGLQATDGNSHSYVPLRAIETHFQFTIPASALVGLNVGDILTSLAFRANGTEGAVGPISIGRVVIGLSTANIATFGANFVANRGADYETVFDGAYSSSVPTGGVPNAFMTPFSFTEGYTYSGGDILVDIAMTAMSTDFRQDLHETNSSRSLFAQGGGAMEIATGDLASNQFAVTQFGVTAAAIPASSAAKTRSSTPAKACALRPV